jgi:hypothetical protein
MMSVSFGQGYVQFFNGVNTRFSTNSPGSSTLYAASAQPVGAYHFALFAAPSTQNTISTSTDPTLNGWTYVAIGTNTAAAGRLNGDNSDNGQAVNVPGFAAGTTADFAIAGWDAALGAGSAVVAKWGGNWAYCQSIRASAERCFLWHQSNNSERCSTG